MYGTNNKSRNDQQQQNEQHQQQQQYELLQRHQFQQQRLQLLHEQQEQQHHQQQIQLKDLQGPPLAQQLQGSTVKTNTGGNLLNDYHHIYRVPTPSPLQSKEANAPKMKIHQSVNNGLHPADYNIGSARAQEVAASKRYYVPPSAALPTGLNQPRQQSTKDTHEMVNGGTLSCVPPLSQTIVVQNNSVDRVNTYQPPGLIPPAFSGAFTRAAMRPAMHFSEDQSCEPVNGTKRPRMSTGITAFYHSINKPELTIDTNSFKQITPYSPQVEAISPTLPSGDADSEEVFRRLKDDLSNHIGNCASDIKTLETTVAKLQMKCAEMESETNADKPMSGEDSVDFDVLDVKQETTLAQNIYTENRRKAEVSHKKYGSLGSMNALTLPLYHEPKDAKSVVDAINKFVYFKKDLIQLLARRKQLEKTRLNYMSEAYEHQYLSWSKKMTKRATSSKRLKAEAKYRVVFETALPELKKQRETEEKIQRISATAASRGTAGYARSEANVTEIMDGLNEQMLKDEKMRKQAADIPIKSLAGNSSRPRFLNENGFISSLEENHLEQIGPTDPYWTESEKLTFTESYLKHPKKFGYICEDIKTKCAKDCCLQYYISKKSVSYKQLLHARNVALKKKVPVGKKYRTAVAAAAAAKEEKEKEEAAATAATAAAQEVTVSVAAAIRSSSSPISSSGTNKQGKDSVWAVSRISTVASVSTNEITTCSTEGSVTGQESTLSTCTTESNLTSSDAERNLSNKSPAGCVLPSGTSSLVLSDSISTAISSTSNVDRHRSESLMNISTNERDPDVMSSVEGDITVTQSSMTSVVLPTGSSASSCSSMLSLSSSTTSAMSVETTSADANSQLTFVSNDGLDMNSKLLTSNNDRRSGAEDCLGVTRSESRQNETEGAASAGQERIDLPEHVDRVDTQIKRVESPSIRSLTNDSSYPTPTSSSSWATRTNCVIRQTDSPFKQADILTSYTDLVKSNNTLLSSSQLQSSYADLIRSTNSLLSASQLQTSHTDSSRITNSHLTSPQFLASLHAATQLVIGGGLVKSQSRHGHTLQARLKESVEREPISPAASPRRNLVRSPSSEHSSETMSADEGSVHDDEINEQARDKDVPNMRGTKSKLFLSRTGRGDSHVNGPSNANDIRTFGTQSRMTPLATTHRENNQFSPGSSASPRSRGPGEIAPINFAGGNVKDLIRTTLVRDWMKQEQRSSPARSTGSPGANVHNVRMLMMHERGNPCSPLSRSLQSPPGDSRYTAHAASPLRMNTPMKHTVTPYEDSHHANNTEPRFNSTVKTHPHQSQYLTTVQNTAAESRHLNTIDARSSLTREAYPTRPLDVYNNLHEAEDLTFRRSSSDKTKDTNRQLDNKRALELDSSAAFAHVPASYVPGHPVTIMHMERAETEDVGSGLYALAIASEIAKNNDLDAKQAQRSMHERIGAGPASNVIQTSGREIGAAWGTANGPMEHFQRTGGLSGGPSQAGGSITQGTSLNHHDVLEETHRSSRTFIGEDSVPPGSISKGTPRYHAVRQDSKSLRGSGNPKSSNPRHASHVLDGQGHLSSLRRETPPSQSQLSGGIQQQQRPEYVNSHAVLIHDFQTAQQMHGGGGGHIDKDRSHPKSSHSATVQLVTQQPQLHSQAMIQQSTPQQQTMSQLQQAIAIQKQQAMIHQQQSSTQPPQAAHPQIMAKQLQQQTITQPQMIAQQPAGTGLSTQQLYEQFIRQQLTSQFDPQLLQQLQLQQNQQLANLQEQQKLQRLQQPFEPSIAVSATSNPGPGAGLSAGPRHDRRPLSPPQTTGLRQGPNGAPGEKWLNYKEGEAAIEQFNLSKSGHSVQVAEGQSKSLVEQGSRSRPDNDKWNKMSIDSQIWRQLAAPDHIPSDVGHHRDPRYGPTGLVPSTASSNRGNFSSPQPPSGNKLDRHQQQNKQNLTAANLIEAIIYHQINKTDSEADNEYPAGVSRTPTSVGRHSNYSDTPFPTKSSWIHDNLSSANLDATSIGSRHSVIKGSATTAGVRGGVASNEGATGHVTPQHKITSVAVEGVGGYAQNNRRLITLGEHIEAIIDHDIAQGDTSSKPHHERELSDAKTFTSDVVIVDDSGHPSSHVSPRYVKPTSRDTTEPITASRTPDAQYRYVSSPRSSKQQQLRQAGDSQTLVEHVIKQYPTAMSRGGGGGRGSSPASQTDARYSPGRAYNVGVGGRTVEGGNTQMSSVVSISPPPADRDMMIARDQDQLKSPRNFNWKLKMAMEHEKSQKSMYTSDVDQSVNRSALSSQHPVSCSPQQNNDPPLLKVNMSQQNSDPLLLRVNQQNNDSSLLRVNMSESTGVRSGSSSTAAAIVSEFGQSGVCHLGGGDVNSQHSFSPAGSPPYPSSSSAAGSSSSSAERRVSSIAATHQTMTSLLSARSNVRLDRFGVYEVNNDRRVPSSGSSTDDNASTLVKPSDCTVTVDHMDTSKDLVISPKSSWIRNSNHGRSNSFPSIDARNELSSKVDNTRFARKTPDLATHSIGSLGLARMLKRSCPSTGSGDAGNWKKRHVTAAVLLEESTAGGGGMEGNGESLSRIRSNTMEVNRLNFGSVGSQVMSLSVSESSETIVSEMVVNKVTSSAIGNDPTLAHSSLRDVNVSTVEIPSSNVFNARTDLSSDETPDQQGTVTLCQDSFQATRDEVNNGGVNDRIVPGSSTSSYTGVTGSTEPVGDEEMFEKSSSPLQSNRILERALALVGIRGDVCERGSTPSSDVAEKDEREGVMHEEVKESPVNWEQDNPITAEDEETVSGEALEMELAIASIGGEVTPRVSGGRQRSTSSVDGLNTRNVYENNSDVVEPSYLHDGSSEISGQTMEGIEQTPSVTAAAAVDYLVCNGTKTYTSNIDDSPKTQFDVNKYSVSNVDSSTVRQSHNSTEAFVSVGLDEVRSDESVGQKIENSSTKLTVKESATVESCCDSNFKAGLLSL